MNPTAPASQSPSKPSEKHPRFINYLAVFLSLGLIVVNILFIYTNRSLGNELFQFMVLIWTVFQFSIFGLPLMIACIVILVRTLVYKEVISHAAFIIRIVATVLALVSSLAAVVVGLYFVL